MAINVAFFKLPGTEYAVLPEDISFGDAGNLTFSTNNQGLVDEQQIVKESVTFKVKGVSVEVLQQLRQQRANNVIGRITGAVAPTDVNVVGYIVEKALLRSVKPEKIVTIEGITLIDMSVEYASLVYV